MSSQRLELELQKIHGGYSGDKHTSKVAANCTMPFDRG